MRVDELDMSIEGGPIRYEYGGWTNQRQVWRVDQSDMSIKYGPIIDEY